MKPLLQKSQCIHHGNHPSETVWKFPGSPFNMCNIWDEYHHWKLPIINTIYLTQFKQICYTCDFYAKRS